jgi:transposase-like protein
MPITPTHPFKGRQYPGEVILLAVRWYLRYPLAYLHVAEILTERGVFIDASCIWRWVQAYAPSTKALVLLGHKIEVPKP